MSAKVWCMWALVSSPQSSPLTRTRITASAASNSSGVTMHGPSTLEPSQSLALPGPMPTGPSRLCTSRAEKSFQIV